ncbi:hypothetical protein HanPSC8_Chr05g0192011 [Helianthus annuus]|nr:hypothetical protein HanPSC8_Chr05g0192011 [Helianthus annuus]
MNLCCRNWFTQVNKVTDEFVETEYYKDLMVSTSNITRQEQGSSK